MAKTATTTKKTEAPTKAPKNAKALAEALNSEHPLARCHPRGDRVVIRRDLPKKQTEGGILLPDTVANAKQQTGLVVRVGPGPLVNGARVPLDLEPGDRVIITGYAGLELRDQNTREGDEFCMLREEDVLAKLS